MKHGLVVPVAVASLMLAFATMRPGWAQGLESRDRGSADPLLRDMVVAQATTGTFTVDLPAGQYQVKPIMGDTSMGQDNMMLTVQGTLINGDIDLVAGQFYQPDIDVTITTLPLTVALSVNDSGYWVINGLTVQQGSTYVHRFDFGGDTSPVADGYTQILPTTVHDPAVGYGWSVQSVGQLNVIKVPDTTAADFPTPGDYMIVLERFPLWAERGWRPSTAPGQPGYFGDGDEGELSMRTMGNYIFVYALLATEPTYDPAVSGVAQAHVLARATECLDHMCRTHVTGDLTRPNGKKWGDHWQSAWWTVRMAAGAKLLWPQLTPDLRAAVERVVTHETDRHTTRTAPSGSSSNTRSEENAWDSEVIAWGPSMFPSHPKALLWREKAKEFFMNSLSAPQDEQDSTVVDGKTVSEWVYTTNIHSDFTIENHGAYHFCYMACPIHSLAWAYHGYTANGAAVPQSLFHHARDVYGMIKRTWLSDGRFAYMAGKDWPRYAYGLYFIMPALVMFQDADNDCDARLLERERFRLFEWESRFSADGGFFSKRFTNNVFTGRLVEYETDCAADLGLCHVLHKRKAPPPPTAAPSYESAHAQTYVSTNIKAALTRDANWFCSWSWRHLGGKAAVGLVIPNGAADMAEWAADQLLSAFTIKNVSSPARTLVWDSNTSLPAGAGFVSLGQIDYTPASGQPTQVERRVAVVALTPIHTAVVIDELWARSSVTLTSLSGCRFSLANDIFNTNARTLHLPGEVVNVRGAGGSVNTQIFSTKCVNIDGRLGIRRVFPENTSPPSALVLTDQASRSAPYGSLCYEQLDWDRLGAEQTWNNGQLIRRTVTTLAAETAGLTEAIGSSRDLALLPTTSQGLVVVSVPGPSGVSYFVAANFDTAAHAFSYEVPAGSKIHPQTVSFSVPARSTHVLQVASNPFTTGTGNFWHTLP